MKQFFIKLTTLIISIASMPILIFTLILSIGSLIHNRDVIEAENRSAMSYKRMSTNFLDGSLQKDFESRMQDQVFGRDFWLKLARTINHAGNKVFYRTKYINGHKVLFVNNGQSIVVDDLWYFFIGNKPNLEKHKANFNQMRHDLLDREIIHIQVPTKALMGKNLSGQGGIENYRNFYKQKDNENENYHFWDLTCDHDFEQYKKWVNRNDHHQTMTFDKYLNEKIADFMKQKLAINFSNNQVKTDIKYTQDGRFHNDVEGPRIPEDYYVRKISGWTKNDYDAFLLNNRSYEIVKKINIWPDKNLLNYNTLHKYNPETGVDSNRWWKTNYGYYGALDTYRTSLLIIHNNEKENVLFLTSSYAASFLIPFSYYFHKTYQINEQSFKKEQIKKLIEKEKIKKIFFLNYNTHFIWNY